MLRRVAASGGVALLGGWGYINSLDQTNGFKRSYKLWTHLAPVVVMFRVMEFTHKHFPQVMQLGATDWVEVFHEQHADHVLNTLTDLKGFYIKVGQVLASRPDTVPKIYVEKLRTLEDAVPPYSAHFVKQIIKDSLETDDITTIFSEFDEVPLGSASIGQVHRARLVTGEEVAVKVQYPGVEKLFRSDIEAARRFCWYLAPEQLIIFDEVEKQFLTEFDYRKEALHLQNTADNLMPRFSRDVVVPRPHLQYCTRDVLVMEFLKGIKLVDGIRKEARKEAKRQGKTLEQLESEMMNKYLTEGLPPPYKGPGRRTIEMYRYAMRFLTNFVNLCLVFVNLGTRAVGAKPIPQVDYTVSLNPARVMDILMRVHGHEIFHDGYFNGDPHAGNFLLLEDERIGMIDYGQVKKLTPKERHQLCRVYIALQRNDEEKLMQFAKELEYKSKYFDKHVLLSMTKFALDSDSVQVTGGRNIQQFMDDMFRQDPWEKTADLLIMPVRAAFLLRGIGLMMNHPVSCCAYWCPIAEAVLAKDGVEY